MTAPTNQWKLGLFVVSGVVIGLVTIMFLAGRALQKESVRYTSFFDEAVTGLNTGSPVSYRGVTIGNVSEINIATDRRHVEIAYDLAVDDLERLGLIASEGRRTQINIPPDLRVQVGSSGVTGTKYLQLDFFRDQTHPRPELPFDVPENYIPATPSTFKSLESSVMQAADQIPVVAKQLESILRQVNEIVTEVHEQKLPTHAAGTLSSASALLSLMHKKLESVSIDQLSDEARATFARANATLARADALLERAGSEQGLLRSVERASDAVGDVAVSANDAVVDVATTMRELRATIDAVRLLAEALERDSDMLVKGRAKTAP
ncbi:MAG: MlaD family protein [Polyangiales bacterium]